MTATGSLPLNPIEESLASLPHRVAMCADSARGLASDFVWDAQDAYLFDVDGTLLRSADRTHVDSFAEAVEQVTGDTISLDGVTLHGGTDTAILAEAFARSGVNFGTLETHCAAILERMAEIVETRRTELRFRRMPGVLEILKWLQAKGALLGVATGNLERIGWTKLEACGLHGWFALGGFSDRFPVREELVGDAAERARTMLGRSQARVCVVGDTPRDIEAARANELAVIAVATGNYSFDELERLKPEVCCSSLTALMEWRR